MLRGGSCCSVVDSVTNHSLGGNLQANRSINRNQNSHSLKLAAVDRISAASRQADVFSSPDRQYRTISTCPLEKTGSAVSTALRYCLSGFAKRRNNRLAAGGGSVLIRDSTVSHRPKLGVFQKGIPSGEATNDHAGTAVHPATAEDKELHETQRCMR